MTKINITNEAEIEAKGNGRHENCKPVLDMTTGEIYASRKDAASILGVHFATISNACKRNYLVKGHKLCSLNKTIESLGEIMAELHNAKEKAAKYDAIMEEQYAAEREAEEKRKAAELHQRKIEKARADVERRRQVLQNHEQRVAESQRKLTQAMAALSYLENIAL